MICIFCFLKVHKDRFAKTDLQKAAVTLMDAIFVQWGLTIALRRLKCWW